MSHQLNITGKSSNEIYTLLYPNNIINFCKYNFTLFLNHCTDLCRLANRTGEYNVEDVYSIRNSISGCHKYYEQNMRTRFEKIVIDCWIEYLCRQNDVSTASLWQSFMPCRNQFEKAVFTRLTEYRHNRAINEWVNLLKLQEYARLKVDFVFGANPSTPAEAGCRANYFDLMFNVAANEQGFPVDEIGACSVYTAGRIPNSPFVLNNASKEIVRNVLKNMDYPDRAYKAKPNHELSDRTAMDAFSVIKTYIPDKDDSLANTIVKSMSGTPKKVYIPESFKAVIDLEIDAVIEDGGVIRKCARCGEYYLKDADYPYDYCSRVQSDGTACIDAIGGGRSAHVSLPTEEENLFTAVETVAEPLDKAFINARIEALYKEMAMRVNVDMTQRDFSNWYQAELRLKEKLLIGTAGESDLEKFEELSRGDEFASKKRAPEPVFQKPKDEEPIEITESGKEVRKFVFERVERPAPKQSLAESEKAAIEAMKRLFAAQEQPKPPPPMPYFQQPQPQYIPPRPTAKVIRGGMANTSYTERSFDRAKPKTVVIPTNEPERKFSPPMPKTRNEEDSDVKLFHAKREVEEDVKIFIPSGSATENKPPKIPFEKIKFPLDEYKRQQEEAEEQIEGQLSAAEIEIPEEKPIPAAPAVSAKALSAYKTISMPKTAAPEAHEPERESFAGILENMNRSDGFESDEEELDADGLPVSHKTKHVMNALFASPKASPFLKINLNDDDE